MSMDHVKHNETDALSKHDIVCEVKILLQTKWIQNN